MCTGDRVFVNARTSSLGALGGDTGTYASDSGSGVECRVESLDASEILEYSAKGMRVSHTVYFASDQALDGSHRLHWTATNGLGTVVDRHLYVQAYYQENSPDGSLQLFIAICDWKDTRNQ